VNSIVEGPDGTIYLGMSLFVAALVPDEGGYRQEWYVPEECRTFRLLGPAECVCTPGVMPW
jgi:hypothetical protein